MAAGKTFMNLAEKIQLCKDYTTLWSDFFKMFADGLEQKKIEPNEEKTFNQIVSLLAFKHYKFAEMMEKKLPDPDGILEVLCEAVSLQQLKELSEAQFSKLQVDWHTEFIAMNKCMGKLIIDLPVDKRTEMKMKQKGADASPKMAKPTPQPPQK
ncbi:hypothetical protein JW926_06945 [Candidatus Sumerlaeota bacterium]|nr:hypothetical protein [Candidatus Sumerlaeota bacterium]